MPRSSSLFDELVPVVVVVVPIIEYVDVCSSDVNGILLDDDKPCFELLLSFDMDIRSYLTYENRSDGLELITVG
jgi:hypothetical protein